jgi:hypothetical protein
MARNFFYIDLHFLKMYFGTLEEEQKLALKKGSLKNYEFEVSFSPKMTINFAR